MRIAYLVRSPVPCHSRGIRAERAAVLEMEVRLTLQVHQYLRCRQESHFQTRMPSLVLCLCEISEVVGQNQVESKQGERREANKEFFLKNRVLFYFCLPLL